MPRAVVDAAAGGWGPVGGLGARLWAEEWKTTSKPLRSSRGRLLERREPLKVAVSVREVELKHPQRPREEAPQKVCKSAEPLCQADE